MWQGSRLDYVPETETCASVSASYTIMISLLVLFLYVSSFLYLFPICRCPFLLLVLLRSCSSYLFLFSTCVFLHSVDILASLLCCLISGYFLVLFVFCL